MRRALGGRRSTRLIGSSEQVDERLDSSALADGDLVGGDLGKLSQGAHHVHQHLFRLIDQQSNQTLQGLVLLKPESVERGRGDGGGGGGGGEGHFSNSSTVIYGRCTLQNIPGLAKVRQIKKLLEIRVWIKCATCTCQKCVQRC